MTSTHLLIALILDALLAKLGVIPWVQAHYPQAPDWVLVAALALFCCQRSTNCHLDHLFQRGQRFVARQIDEQQAEIELGRWWCEQSWQNGEQPTMYWFLTRHLVGMLVALGIAIGVLAHMLWLIPWDSRILATTADIFAGVTTGFLLLLIYLVALLGVELIGRLRYGHRW